MHMQHIWVDCCQINWNAATGPFGRRAKPDKALANVNARRAGSSHPSHLDFLLRHAIHAVLTQRRFTVVVPSRSRFLFLSFVLGESLDIWEACGLKACVSSSALTAAAMTQMIVRRCNQELAKSDVAYASMCYDRAQPADTATPIIIRPYRDRAPYILSQELCNKLETTSAAKGACR